MAGKGQASTAHQTMKFVYSEAVNRALRRRCRGLQASSTDDGDGGCDGPPLPPELLLAVLHSGELDLSALSSGKPGRLPNDTDTAAPDDVDFEISNLAEIYREISRAVQQVRQRSMTANDAQGAAAGAQQDRPATRASVPTTSKTPSTTNDNKNKPPTVKSPRQATNRTTAANDSQLKRQKDARKVQFNTRGKQESICD